MSTAYEVSTSAFTCVVIVDEQGVIIKAAPYVRRAPR